MYINGREWLARRLDEEGIGSQRRDNCFTWVEDFPRAQGFADAVCALVKAAAVNPSDVKAATGLMPYAVFPRTPGRDSCVSFAPAEDSLHP